MKIKISCSLTLNVKMNILSYFKLLSKMHSNVEGCSVLSFATDYRNRGYISMPTKTITITKRPETIGQQIYSVDYRDFARGSSNHKLLIGNDSLLSYVEIVSKFEPMAVQIRWKDDVIYVNTHSLDD